MTRSILFVSGLVLALAVACGSSSSEGGEGASSSGGTDGGAPDGTTADTDGGGATTDGGATDGSGSTDGSSDADAQPAVPAVQTIGRFDFTDAQNPKTSWPGARIIAQFDGTGVGVTLSSTAGSEGAAATWMNVYVDGAPKPKILVDGANKTFALASGLPAGTHTVEIEKRTEASWGTLTFHGFTFDGGGKLLPPPARAARRIEFLAESTIDGFGVDGDVATTCMGGAPAEYNDARKSMAFYTAKALSAEHHLVAQSGKGLVRNSDPGDTTYYPAIYGRTLAEDPASTWNFASWTPDVVVISLGGADYDGGDTTPNGFQAAYDGLVTSIRTRYPNAHVFMTVWSQIKDPARPAMKGVLDAIKAAHAADTKLHVFQLTEATYPVDETGCYEHATDAHHQETAAELVPVIKAATGW